MILTIVGKHHWFSYQENSTQNTLEIRIIPGESQTKQTANVSSLPDTPSYIEREQSSSQETSQHTTPNEVGQSNSSNTTQTDIFETNSVTSPIKEPGEISSLLTTTPTNGQTDHKMKQVIAKPDLLDLSDFSLSSETSNKSLKKVFSPTLQKQIEASQKAQKEYLKGQTKETEYPITVDADGTRYVNIKGVCWRIPKEGSTDEWAIVFSGCNGQTKTFHLELNISPSTLLGPDSPFSLLENEK